MNAQWFDGRSAAAHPVEVIVSGQQLLVSGEQINNVYAVADIQWPERTRAGSRILRLPDNSTLHAPTGKDWNALARAAGAVERTVVRWQQSGPRVLLALLLLLALGVGGYLWGVPLVARAALAFVPNSVDKKIGEAFLEQVGDEMVGASTLPASRQREITDKLNAVIKASYLNRSPPEYTLLFRSSKVGANAFALPGNFIILTDELVSLANNDEMVVGVLAHELGHVIGRHSMRMVGQTLLIGTLSALAFGDYANMIATIPLLLGQMAYSREFEREADEQSIVMLKAAGISPLVMAQFFEKLNEDQKNNHGTGAREVGILLSSHPATDERIARFRNAAKP